MHCTPQKPWLSRGLPWSPVVSRGLPWPPVRYVATFWILGFAINFEISELFFFEIFTHFWRPLPDLQTCLLFKIYEVNQNGMPRCTDSSAEFRVTFGTQAHRGHQGLHWANGRRKRHNNAEPHIEIHTHTYTHIIFSMESVARHHVMKHFLKKERINFELELFVKQL